MARGWSPRRGTPHSEAIQIAGHDRWCCGPGRTRRCGSGKMTPGLLVGGGVDTYRPTRSPPAPRRRTPVPGHVMRRRRDALFELVDGLLAAESMPSLPHLSLPPVHRRGWGSVYAALAVGEVHADRIAELLAARTPQVAAPVFAVDASTWPRCDAEC